MGTHSGGMSVRDAAVGRYGERVAVRHLQEAGVEILARNWRPHGQGLRGELDIVARDAGVLVAVEVKTRRGRGSGFGLEAVTPAKLGQLRRLLLSYLPSCPVPFPAGLRIDVVDVLVSPAGAARVTHLTAVG